MAVVAAAAFRSAFPINSILSEAESLVIVGQLIVSWRSLAVVAIVPLNLLARGRAIVQFVI